MSKAEDRALEKYPVLSTELGDINSLPRIGYTEGYHQAEKDLKLTWEDIRKICLIAREVHKYYGFWSDIVYQDILNRFNEQKEDGKV